MASSSWDRLKQIIDAFHEEQPEDRAAWLDDKCRGDEDLRREVKSLLDADEEDYVPDEEWLMGFLPGEASDEERAPTSLAGSDAGQQENRRVGPYRLLEEIGVGGMSIVYRGKRADGAFERAVAVKLLQRRLHSDGAQQRFRAERQVLASLDHPNITRLVDGGVTEGGQPYLVMEHVDGVPITEYVSEEGLSLEARLDLMRQVAEAIQAAHRQLVVHRDLKPSNVLVTETEAGPQVKLLDFGIAKLLGDTLPVTRPETRAGRQPLTLAYASPEQVEGGEISTQTDVYQLGALTYELMAGTRPFDLRGTTLAEAEQIIREEQPVRPSDQAGHSGQSRSEETRSGESRSGKDGVPTDSLRGDLDMVVMKALRKEPSRRYSSAEAFAKDLQRYREDRPVEARPATPTYRAKKFFRRNAATTGVVAAFLAVVVFSAALLVRQRNRAQKNAEAAEREARKAERVSGYLIDLLQSARPDESGEEGVTATDMLRRGQRQIDRLKGQPAVQARMLQLLGNAYRERDRYSKAAGLLRRSLAIRDSVHDSAHRHVANTIEEIAHLRQKQGRYQKADSLWRAALARHEALFGPRSPKLWEPLNNLGRIATSKGRLDEADSLYQAALAAERAAPVVDSSRLGITIGNLAAVPYRRGHYARADSLHELALTINRQVHEPPHPDVATGMLNLGFMRFQQDRYADADSLFSSALSMYRAVYDPPNSNIANALRNFGIARMKQDKYRSAASLLREASLMYQAIHENPHRIVATTLYKLAEVRAEQGDLATADSILRRSTSIVQEALGRQHPQMGYSLISRGDIRAQQDRFGEAASLYRKARSILRRRLPDDHSRVAAAEAGLGRALAGLDRYSEAEPLLKQSLQVFQDKGKESKVQAVRTDLESLYTEWGRPGSAARYRNAATAGNAE